MKRFEWERKSITPKEYFISFVDNLSYDETKKNKLEKAYNVISDIRKFEIELFWKRATFFWAFIAAIYTAYYHVLTKIYFIDNHYTHGAVPLIIFAALGLFFCFSWLLSSKASKHWQENWENHLDLLEDDVTGPLYKIYQANSSYSVSKITIIAGWVVSFCAYCLLIFEFVCFVDMYIFSKKLFSLVFSIGFSFIVIVLLFVYSQIVKGNQDNFGSFGFEKKEYKVWNEK